jgi:hypothetical protein
VLARLGASGDAREPHLHFEVTTSPKIIRGEGIPYLLHRYRSTSNTNGSVEAHTDDLPLDKNLVEFEEAPVK